MFDVVVVALTLLYFGVNVAFALGCDRLIGQREDAVIENIVLTVISLAVLIYLFVALVRPEVF